jgi:hypothetical protein
MRGQISARHRTVAVAAGATLALLAWYAATSRGTTEDPWPAQLGDQAFWAMVQEFSEPGGSFTAAGGYRSDNLISNERSLQQVMPGLNQFRRSGAYVGVGPEQNFTYIAALEPTIAFVIDIRRENLLLHLLYKALAEESDDRVAFLSRLFGRQRPPGLGAQATAQAIFTAFDRSPWSATLAQATVESVIGRLEGSHGFPLSLTDKAGIADIYARFGEGGPTLRWDSVGGSWIPSYAELMSATDTQGMQRSYLASEEAFQVFRRYQLRNRIVPLVGNFGGKTTLRAVGHYLKSQGAVVSVFYTSNVQAYLGDAQAQFAANVAALPRLESSALIHTAFRMVGSTHSRPDYRTTTVMRPIQAFVESWAAQ